MDSERKIPSRWVGFDCGGRWSIGGGGVSWNQGVAKATQGAITCVTLQLQKRKTLTIVFTTCFGERFRKNSIFLKQEPSIEHFITPKNTVLSCF
jgi:hypothetical protein